VEENVMEELTPRELLDERADILRGVPGGPRGGEYGPRRDRSEVQVRRKPRCAAAVGTVAVLGVARGGRIGPAEETVEERERLALSAPRRPG
jgi:hypothetical protein